MTTASYTPGKGLIEIRIGGESFDLEKYESNHIRLMDERELIALLQDRLKKSTPEIQQLLQSYS